MSAIGCYTLDLYCDNIVPLPENGDGEVRNRVWRDEQAKHGNDWPHQYMGETHGSCVRQARKNGWVFHRNGGVTCPRCAKMVRA